ncbi:nucleotide-binding oligomerization domain-containing protein 1-like [Oculina patagonica]
MEYLRELLAPKTFNRLSHVVVITWTLFGVILLSIFATMDNSEPRFACSAKSKNMDLVPEKCLEQYEKRYNKLGVPVYAFVIVNFSFIGIICVIYSQVVKSRVEQLLEANLNRDAERQRPPETRKLFAAYCCQLTARFALGILFIVVQTQVLYPSNFPTDFSCDLTLAESTSAANASDANIQNTTKNIYECHNQQAAKKTFWTNSVSVVNGLFALVILIEIIWILSRAIKRRTFMKDRQFFANYLTKTNYVHPLQVELQQETQQENTQQERNETPQEQPVTSFLEMMKRSIIENTAKPPDLKALFTTNAGEGLRTKHLSIDNIYTNLVLHPERAEYDFPEDREQQLKVYPKPKDFDAENLKPKGPEDIVDTEKKKILIIGRPGIGKSLFSTRLLRDWASGKVFNSTQDTELHFNIAFLIKFRRFNVESSNSEERLSLVPLSLRELLERAEFLPADLPDDVWNDIVGNPDKVLILFDGMDELADEDLQRINNEAVDDSYRNSVEQKMPLATLYTKLMNGKLLRGASVLTTTRPTAVSSIEQLNDQFQRVFEILGFAPEQVKEYVKSFTREAAENESGAGEQILHHINSNMNLFSFCYVPVNCFIICSSLLEELKFSLKSGLTGGGLPVKLTQIYKTATKVFFFRHNEQYRNKPFGRKEIQSKELPPDVEKQFKDLGELAFKGIKERRLIFGSSEVPQELENSSLFHKMPDRQSSAHEHEAQFCFIHLTMQEFLAAKHITETKNEAELRTFVKDHINKGEWHVVLQFVAGFLGERDEQLMKIFTDLLPEKTEEEDELLLMDMSPESERRTFTCWPTESEKHLALTIIKCIYEGSESNVVLKSKKNISFNAVDFSQCSLAPADCTAIAHVFKHVQHISLIDLSANHFGSLGCAEITKLFDNDNSQLTRLNLWGNNIGDEGVKQLSKVIVKSNLESLNLHYNSITDKGLNYLSNKLVNTNVKSLDLGGNSNITYKGLNYLSNKLVNTNVKSLDLGGNSNITREAKQRIQDANPNCKFIF